ncbi:MAG: RNA 3'-terminal phosphate cyclase [Pseudomonadales bacterium]
MTRSEQIYIDGSQGEGGGQILRTALSLAMCLGQPVTIDNIRAGRSKPGLMRSHLAAARAAASISSGTLEGDQLGSTGVAFSPGSVRGGSYRFAIGTAGSTTLLWQTLLPALLLASEPSDLTLEGGTHNGMAPSVDFIEHAFLPVLGQLGIQASLRLLRHGFYPNGGGAWQVHVEPWQRQQPLQLTQRGASVGRHAVAKVALVRRSVAERELARVQRKLGWSDHALEIATVEAVGPGNIVSLRVSFEQVTEVFEALGELRLSAERVAGRAITQVREYLAADYPVAEYLADQLLLPMAIGPGGVFRTGRLSAHTRTNVAVIEQFLGRGAVTVEEDESETLISVRAFR